MQDKICLIKQPAGIGDIFFCQKIARTMMRDGYKIIWPVRSDIAWIGNYIKDISFPTTEDFFPMKDIYDRVVGYAIEKDFAFISTATANFTHNDGNNMTSKYSMLDVEYNNWQDYFKFNRNFDKENKLYYDVLGLKDNSEYVYVNSYYNTDNHITDMFIGKEFDYPVIENEIIEGYTLFDWCKVLENAKELYTTNTSVCYLLDVIDTKGELFYYCRKPEYIEEHKPLFRKKINWN